MKPVYKRMLESMKTKRKHSADKEPWFLYILKCSDGSFYTGITKDIERRFKVHNEGKAAKYTRTRLPVELLYREKCKNRTMALVRECAVKALPRKKKEEIISSKFQV